MAPDPVSGRRSVSPESSGRDSPIPRHLRNQLGAPEDHLLKDKSFRRYAASVDKALSLFETALEEWADYISFLNKLLKALQARPTSITTIPAKALVAKRLSQCLNPSLPSGVHQKALEVYSYVFSTIGRDGLSRDLPLYLPGLATTLSFASLSVRSPYLDLLEAYFLGVDPRSLKPAMKSIILGLLPGLEDETAEDFDRTLRLVTSFKEAIRPANSELLTQDHATGDNYFWQCFFLASITSNGRRPGALAYLVRYLPSLGSTPNPKAAKGSPADQPNERVIAVVTSPEPGLLIRSFASGLSDEQLLIQRGFLDLLVSHLPLNSPVLQSKMKAGDLELLLKAAVGVVTRRDMSLNRRLWAWFLGPEPAPTDDQVAESPGPTTDAPHPYSSSRTSYFEEFGLQPLTKALLSMIKQSDKKNATDRAKPYRICLSLMDRWEIGGLVVPEVFLPVLENVKQFKTQATSKSEFAEVLRSASVFFDGIESGLIYGELIGQLAQAIGPGNLGIEERNEKLALVTFILANFNVREEEMVTIHAPLSCLAVLSMLEGSKENKDRNSSEFSQLTEKALSIAITFLELVPRRAFPDGDQPDQKTIDAPSNMGLLKRIENFYVSEQGNTEASKVPLSPQEIGALLLQKTVGLICDEYYPVDLAVRTLSLSLAVLPSSYRLDVARLLSFFQERLGRRTALSFSDFSAVVHLATELHAAERLSTPELSRLATLLVNHAWTYLSAADPKFHVETVRNLWQLQTSLSIHDRNLEAALASLLVSSDSQRVTPAGVHTFNVLWSHTLQDNPSDRRGGRTPVIEQHGAPRVAGMDHFEVMLTRPVFLVLDELLDEKTKSSMTVKSWLNSMIGIDRLFLIFAYKFCELGFLEDLRTGEQLEKPITSPTNFSEDDDLELCLYYLQALFNVLNSGGDLIWAVLASKFVSLQGATMHITSGGEEGDLSLQDFFVRVCLRCITGEVASTANVDLTARVSELQRFALRVLHQFYHGHHAATLANLHLEYPLIDRLSLEIASENPYSQVLLLDVINIALKIRDAFPADVSSVSAKEKRAASIDPSRTSRPSLNINDERPPVLPPPPQLLKCLQSALASPGSRPVLDSWVSFLTECLPLYTDSIFQILIPLVETLCSEIGQTFSNLRDTFQSGTYTPGTDSVAPESTLIYLLNGLEQVLARAHDQLLVEEARAQLIKSPDQPQSIFGSMVSNVFQSDSQHTRSATANNRLTVHLAFQDATRMCYNIWAWGLGETTPQQDESSLASFKHTSLRMRNRARRMLEHLFTAETLECLETVIDVWKNKTPATGKAEVFNLLSALEASRPRRAVPALFNSIYSRTNPSALDPSRKSTMTISLEDADLVHFLVEYARSLDDDAMDEIWQDCIVFLKDLLSNPFPHRQNLPSLLEFAAILGEKVDNTNFGEQRKMRRELGDLFLKLLAALFTTRPMTFTEPSSLNGASEKSSRLDRKNTSALGDGTADVVQRLASIVPNLPKILVEPDRVLSAAGSISTNVIGPALRSKSFPDTISESTMDLLHELSRLQNNQKTWKKDVAEALNDSKFFGVHLSLVKDGWLPLLRQWILTDKEKMLEIVTRISPPSTAGIVFGVGATSARLEADRKTQVNLRRIAVLVLASAEDAFVADLPVIFEKLVELLAATAVSSPSSTTRADVYMVIRALVLRISPIHLAMIWPVVNAELHAAVSSITAPENSSSSATETYTNQAVLQACKLLDLLICVSPDDFQLHEWLFITDTIDAVYRYSNSQSVALADELAEELGGSSAALHNNNNNTPSQSSSSAAQTLLTASSWHRRPMLGLGGIDDEDVSIEKKEDLVAKILRPFFGQLSIFAFESTYAMGVVDREICEEGLLRDLFDDRTIVKAP